MIHTFDRVGVARLLAHTRAASEHDALYEKPETATPGLFLVGDEGVYLVSNGKPFLPRTPRSKKPLVVYALECNPLTMPFETWWRNKRAGFGADDGIEFLPAEILEQALQDSIPDAPLQLNISDSGISILVTRPHPPTRRKKAGR